MPVRRERSGPFNVGSPCQSDETVLITVEHLINMAMGPATGNTINFKLLQAILHIFARQLRMMEQHVEIQIAGETSKWPRNKPTKSKYTPTKRAYRHGSGSAESRERQRICGLKKCEKRDKSPYISSSDYEKKKTRQAKDKTENQKEKENMEGDKLANMNEEEKERYFKDKEKTMLAEMDEKAREKYIKEEEEENRERQKKIISNMDTNEKAMFAELNDKEKTQYLLEKGSKDKEKAKLAKLRKIERELHLHEKEKAKKERKRDEINTKATDRDETEETDESDETDETGDIDTKHDKREREKRILAKMDEKEKKKIARMDKKERTTYVELKEKEKRLKKQDADHTYEKMEETEFEEKETVEETEKEIFARMNDTEKEKFRKLDEKEKVKYIKEKRADREKGISTKIYKKEQKEYAKVEKTGNKQYLEEKITEESMLAAMDENEKQKSTKMDERNKKKYISGKEKEYRDKEAKNNETKEEMLANMDEKEMVEKRKQKHLTEIEKQSKKAILAKMDKNEKEIFAKMDEIAKEKYLKGKIKEESILTSMSENEIEKYAKLNEKDKEEYISSKKKEITGKQTKKDEKSLAKMDEKEKTEFGKMDEKRKEKYINEKTKRAILAKMGKKEQEKFAKMDDIGKEKYLEEKFIEEPILATMGEDEKVRYSNMDETKREKHLRDLEKRGRDKANARKGEKDERNELLLTNSDEEEKTKEKLPKTHDLEEAKLGDMNEKEKEEYLKEIKERGVKEKSMLSKMTKKEQEKFSKMDKKGKEKYLKQIEMENIIVDNMNEKEKMQFSKMDKKEKEHYLIAKMSGEKHDKAGKEKTGLFPKGNFADRSASGTTRVGSIEVVTVSQFDILKAEVNDLLQRASPIPLPTMPDNETLRLAIARGSASLTDTMQAMQVSARMLAAETAISQIASVLTNLATSGVIPMDVAEKIEDIMVFPVQSQDKSYVDDAFRKSKGGEQGALKESYVIAGLDGAPAGVGRGLAGSTRQSAPPPTKTKVVCRNEFDSSLRCIRDDLTKNANSIASKTQKIAEAANNTAQHVSEKLELLVKLNTRVDGLHDLVSDYYSQFSGFDAGVTSQMDTFNEQMRQIRRDMEEGVKLLLSATNVSESEAIQELRTRFNDLVAGLDVTVHSHNKLNKYQSDLAEELSSLLEVVEMLRDEKADRDELLDGLKDKADICRLNGLMTEKASKRVYDKLEHKLSLSYGKFLKQDRMWMKALHDLSLSFLDKADNVQVDCLKKDTEDELNKIHRDMIALAKALGDPKAALLTRQLSIGALCGPCRTPALQEISDVCGQQPPSLPALGYRPVEDKPCEGPVKIENTQGSERPHVCNRWVGGSHTVMSDAVVRRQAAPLQSDRTPHKKYVSPGADGRMYKMEGTLDPCMQCNKITSPIDLKVDGTGDSVKNSNVLLNNKDQ